MSRGRILIVTRNLPPLWGGMELLNLEMARQLARYFEVRIVGPAGAAAHLPESIRVAELPLAPLALFLLRAFWRACRTARAWRPDVVLAGSGLTAPIAWLAARSAGADSAVYLHGLDIGLDTPLYRLLWKPAIRRIDRVIANSRATADLAVRSGVDCAKIKIVHPGVELPAPAGDSVPSDRFREEHGLADARILLSVGRLTERKGLREFVRDVLPRIVEACPSAMLVVIGDAPRHSLYAASQSRDSIQAAAEAAGVGRHLEFLGVITDRDRLAAAYRAADVHVFPVREIEGDPEGFGMVAVEAASFGLATVAYATGGVVDAVSAEVSGYLVPPGDAATFAQQVRRELDSPLPREPVVRHAAGFAWPQFGLRMSEVLSTALPRDRA